MGGRLLVAAWLLMGSTLAAADCTSRLVETGNRQLTEAQIQTLRDRYGVSASEVVVTPNTGLPVLFRMDGAETLTPSIPVATTPVRELKTYDAVVVGGGPSGLTAALYLAEAGKSVLIVERNEKLGGLGMGSELNGIRAAGGAAYSAGPEPGLEEEIFGKIGLSDYQTRIDIAEPIDSYLWNGVLYEAIWEDHTLEHLPASFALFKHALLKLAANGAGRDDTALGRKTDKQTMAQLVRQMPKIVASWRDPQSIALIRNLRTDNRLNKKDPMIDVLDLLDLYGRSALGSTTDNISARQFIDFYESELVVRYTGTLGTGTISEALTNTLEQKYSHLVEFRVSAPVAEVENTSSGAVTRFIENGVLREVASRKVIYAAPLSTAPKIIKDLEILDKRKARAISEIEMTDYAVYTVRVKGHPYRATYDTWVNINRDHSKPTDYILGRWQDERIRAYDGTRDFKRDPSDDYGVIAIYHPLGKADAANFHPETMLPRVEAAVLEMLHQLNPLVRVHDQKIEIELIEAYKWPQSIHIVHPGYLSKVPLLSRAAGNIHFVNNMTGGPELETSMGTAAREVLNIIGDKQNLSAAQ